MLKTLPFCASLLLTVLLFSCKSSEDLTYLKDMQNLELQQGLPAKPAEYRIKANDNLYVKIVTLNEEVNAVFNQMAAQASYIGTQQMYGDQTSQFLNGNIVDKDGDITLPILGKVRVEGLTIPESEAAVNKKAGDYLKEYTVQVKLLSYKFSMLGEFKLPGIYYNYNNNITILEAVSRAGGLTDFAGLGKVMVVRPTPDGYKSYRVDLASKSLLTSEAFYLQPDDVVYAGPDKNKNTSLNAVTYSLLLSSITTLLVILQFFKF